MSEENVQEKEAAQAEALVKLSQKIYLPVFLEKCAEFGINPQSEEEVSDLLKIATLLRLAEAQAPQQAAQTGGVIEKAASGLEHLLTAESPVDQVLHDPEIAGALQTLSA